MKILYIIFLLLAAAAAAVFTVRRSWKTDVVSLLLKTAASLLFITLGSVACVVSASAGSFDPAAVFVLTGLAFSLSGDIMLDLKYVHAEAADRYTFAGFASFMCTHVFYSTFLLAHYGFLKGGLLLSLAIGIAAGVGIYLTPKLLRLDYDKFRIISSVYAAILIFTTAYAGCCWRARGGGGTLGMFLGLILFLISDLILSQIYFGADKNTPALKAANHAFYYAGQILIAASLAAM